MIKSLIFDELILNRNVIFMTGKGGIGKTALTACLALRAQELGRRVLVVEQSSIEQIGPLLGFQGVGHEELWRDGLGVANFTAAGNFRDFVTKHLMKSSLLEMIVRNRVVYSFFTSIPGFSELMLLGRIFYAMNLAPEPRPDLVVVDAYASGHFLNIMTTPDAVMKSGLAGPIIQQTKMVYQWLHDHSKCTTVYIAVPEELVVSEALDFLPTLQQKSPVCIETIVLNRCLNLNSQSHRTSEFLLDRQRRETKVIHQFMQEMSQNMTLRSLSVVKIPDVGVIPEPIDPQTMHVLLGGCSS